MLHVPDPADLLRQLGRIIFFKVGNWLLYVCHVYVSARNGRRNLLMFDEGLNNVGTRLGC